jgi:NAD(P)-dependent dehydrogenase (short-subunit alcohol dehydrogenase family)
MKLANQRALITGASRGLGFAIAKEFAKEGAHLLLCAREEKELGVARRAIGSERKLITCAADVSIEADVHKLTRLAAKELNGIDILVCNAGIYGPKGPLADVDWEEWSKTISINLLGTALCCKIFLPLLRKSRRGKILLLSGGGATKPLPFLSAYAASKAAVVRFGETLAEELRGAGIDVNSIAPGALNTRLLDEVIAAGPDRVGIEFHNDALKQKQSGGTPLERAARLSVFLASADSDGLTGKLISAVWDPWNDLSAHKKDLDSTDVYTLRRIVPSDRGLKWA